MGCVFAKESSVQLVTESRKEQNFQSGRKRFPSGRLTPAEIGNGVVVEKEQERAKLKSKPNGTAATLVVSDVERKRDKNWIPVEPNPRLSTPPKHIEGEQVAAGWPAWLSAVAGEAIKGWIPRRADSFEKLDKIGQGTYSNVYKARDLDTGKIVALKKVRFDNLEPESVRFMAREIQVLRCLDHPNVVKLEGLVTSRMSCSLYLVFEYMEHDLAGLAAVCPGATFSEPQVKCYLQQLLRGLDHCHSRSILHRDIKGSNLLLDNGGILKIADFGLATFFHPDQKQALTSRVVTLWYRPPELLLGTTEYGIAVDLWSTGCILAELLAGKPIMPGRTEVEQLHKIFKLCGSPSEEYWKKSKLPHATIFKPQQPYKRCIAETFKDFPPSAISLLETLLAIEPSDRGTAASALKSEFFTTKPLACDPASLPKYPPSKEFDAKIREEEARCQRAAGGRVRGLEASKRVGHATKAVPAPDANAELAASIQKRRLTSYAAAKSKSEKFNPKQEDSAVGFPIDPPRPSDVVGGGHAHAPPPARSGLPVDPNVAALGFRKQMDKEAHLAPPLRHSHSTKSATVLDLKSQSSYGSQTGDLSSMSTLVSARSNGSREFGKEVSSSRQRDKYGGCVVPQNNKYELYEGQADSRRLEMSSRVSEGFHPKDSAQRDRPPSGKPGKTQRLHFSGPLLPPSANLDAILGERERRIQAALRRAKQDKVVNQNNASSLITRGTDANEVDNGCGPPVSSSGRWKSLRPQSIGEIVESGETEKGLPSVIENYEKEQET